MMNRNRSQFLIAAPTSDSGKTTVCRGLMELFAGKGLKVQPFKCGPDYIDTKFHERACGQPSVNLDLFMSSAEHLRELYETTSANADLCIVEGMMGMFDGYDRSEGSSAAIARLLQIPVILVVDAHASAYSAAALISGFRDFDPSIHLIGVIFNKVSGPAHAEILRGVCHDLGIEYFGSLLRRDTLTTDSRYLGLDFSVDEAVPSLSAIMEEDLLWESLLEATAITLPVDASALSPSKIVERSSEALEQNQEKSLFPFSKISEKPMHIVIARNADAFSFIYTEHLTILSRLGKLFFIDPEQATELPEKTDLLYLPGGYPEKHAEALSRNKLLCEDIKRYIEEEGRVLAECGGMIYLSQGIQMDDAFYPMVGAFPFSIDSTPKGKRLTLGYRQLEYRGISLRGHEFHFTQIAEGEEALLPSIAPIHNAAGEEVSASIYRYKNAIAGYTHLYWGGINPLSLFD